MIALPSKRVLCQYSQLKDGSIFGGIAMGNSVEISKI